jgi:hypothetical protein
VRLGVALLKDRNGRIDLNLPVSGSLDDPQFSIRALVWKAIVNILLKVATSPFALLGAMFGGGEELQYVDFAPGSATLADAQTNKLNKLTKALYERPALNLEISGSADTVADREALARQNLRNKINSLRAQELTARGKPVPVAGELKLEDSDYDRLLRKAYNEAFKTTPERALREARTAAAATNAAGAASAATSVASRPAEITKGAMQLAQGLSGKTATLTRGAVASPGSAAAPAKPKTEDELIRDELEQRLMTTTSATDDDLRGLMQERAETVEKLLLGTGKVTAERLFLVAPKPVDPSVKGAAQATFSLN